MSSILGRFAGPIRRCVLRAWRLAACDCYLSDGLRDEAAGLQDVPKTRIVISNPISPTWLREAPLPRGEREGDLVFFGRWSPEKGIDELLSVMRTLDAGRPVHATSTRIIARRRIPRIAFVTAGCRKKLFARSCARRNFCCSPHTPRHIRSSCSKRRRAARPLSPRTLPEYLTLPDIAAAACCTKPVI